MSSPLKQNTITIQNLIDTINNLPEAGVELPELSNPATASELFLNKELIDGEGNIITGTFSLDNELSTQDDLIAQIQAAIDELPEANEGGGTVKTATVTLSNIMYGNYPVCYMSPSGAQQTTHSASPFTCVVPSIMYLDHGNAVINLSGSITQLHKTYNTLILNITGDGTITLTSDSTGSND